METVNNINLSSLTDMVQYNVIINRDEYRSLIQTSEKYNLERRRMRELIESEVSEKYENRIKYLKDQLDYKDLEIEKIKTKSSKKCMISNAINIILIGTAVLLAFLV